MARTALFRKFAKLLKLSVAQQEKKLSDQDLAEILGAQRSGQVYKYLSRRGFISQVAASAGMMAGTGLSPLLIGCRTTATQSQVASAKLDHSGRIVIVGGGTAGLTAAYRLMQAGIGSSLYEGSERLGGRMYTENNFNAEGMFCERGGELVDTYHKDLQALCAELGLEIQEFSEDNESLVEAIYYISGKVYYDEDIIAAFKPLAAALLRDQALLTRQGELGIPTYKSELAKSDAVRKLDQMSLAEYLNQVEAESWLKEMIRISYVGEYGLEADKQSALNLVLLINSKTDEGFKLFGESDESKRIK
ncbi:MAG: FAD-dependent oxidoreductase, partial [Proteobacteria bacterium]|nr:FAD-dependent oxidoreductase [Pseudomonadota bacterium]